MVIGLIGNQNCGKTTLFNQLTGSNQHVGNFPGVTVEQKAGGMKADSAATLVDLPGIYSLSPYTSEEVVTRDFLINEKPDAVINIVDATNIERNLYLTLQVLELKIPTVLALNMMDEVRANGISINIPKLSEELGVPVLPIAASKNEGVAELAQMALQAAREKLAPKRLDFCSGDVHRAIHSISHMIEDHAQRIGVTSRFCATKLVEGDPLMAERLQLSENELDAIGHVVDEMEQQAGTDREAALADMRYDFITRLCEDAVGKPEGESREHRRSVRIDNLLTHKIWAIPIFLGVMLLIFWLTFGVIGSFLSDLLSMGIDGLSDLTARGLELWGVNPVVRSLVIDGIFAGVGSVLSFLPLIVVLFFFLSLLEDSGYMARVAFVMDKLLRKIGLSGRSFVPMLIGFGCSVPAILSARTLSSERDRRMTILLVPFMSCSAKIPIYALFAAAFFARGQALVMVGMYAMGIAVCVIVALILKTTGFRGNPVPFVMELPNYRFPSWKSVLLLMWDKAKDFLQRAFGVIFVATVIVWFLQTFDAHLNVVADSADSLLAAIGQLLAPLFRPLGFGDWRAATALISGFIAKESVVSTLGVLLGSNSGAALYTLFTPATAFSFLTFTLLYTPCVAAIAAIKRELGSGLRAAGVSLLQCAIAWLCAFGVYALITLF